jgi:hypothetical protein
MDELRVNVSFEGRTEDPTLLRHVLTTLGSLEPLAPQYWGRHDRKREPWDIEAILASFARFLGGLQLWRTKAPRYQGIVSVSKRSVGSVRLTFAPGPSPKHLEALYTATESLVQSVPMLFAFVHPIWRDGPEVAGTPREEISQYIVGANTNLVDVCKLGLQSVFSRTWFGPMLADRIGRERLLGIEGIKQDDRGGVRFDLVSEPWKATFKELACRKKEVMRHLQSSGMFMDIECGNDGNYRTYERAPNWICPDWVM